MKSLAFLYAFVFVLMTMVKANAIENPSKSIVTLGDVGGKNDLMDQAPDGYELVKQNGKGGTSGLVKRNDWFLSCDDDRKLTEKCRGGSASMESPWYWCSSKGYLYHLEVKATDTCDEKCRCVNGKAGLSLQLFKTCLTRMSHASTCLRKKDGMVYAGDEGAGELIGHIDEAVVMSNGTLDFSHFPHTLNQVVPEYAGVLTSTKGFTTYIGGGPGVTSHADINNIRHEDKITSTGPTTGVVAAGQGHRLVHSRSFPRSAFSINSIHKHEIDKSQVSNSSATVLTMMTATSTINSSSSIHQNFTTHLIHNITSHLFPTIATVTTTSSSTTLHHQQFNRRT